MVQEIRWEGRRKWSLAWPVGAAEYVVPLVILVFCPLEQLEFAVGLW